MTSRTRLPSAPRSGGFTLIELLLVVTLLVVLSAVVFPRMTGTAHAARLSSSAEDMAALARFARLEAVRSGRSVRFNISLDRRSYWLSRQDAESALGDGYTSFDDPLLDRRRVLPEGVRVGQIREELRPLLVPIITFGGGSAGPRYEIDLVDAEERKTRVEIGPLLDDVRVVRSPDDSGGILR